MRKANSGQIIVVDSDGPDPGTANFRANDTMPTRVVSQVPPGEAQAARPKIGKLWGGELE